MVKAHLGSHEMLVTHALEAAATGQIAQLSADLSIEDNSNRDLPTVVVQHLYAASVIASRFVLASLVEKNLLGLLSLFASFLIVLQRIRGSYLIV
jgi:hypothetical protein